MKRATLQRIVQWAFTICSVVLILRVIDVRSMLPILAAVDLFHFALALAIALAHFFVGAWRWKQLMLLYNAANVPLWRLFDLYIASFFVSSVLPGTITGDGLRIYGTRNEAGGSTGAFAIVLIERLLGVAILIVIGATAWLLLPTHPDLQFSLPRWEYGLVLFAAVVVGVAILAFVARALFIKVWSWALRLLALVARLPGLALRRPLVATKVLGASLLYQMLSVLIVFEAMRSTGVPLPLTVFLTVIPVVTVLLMLPVSVQGIGVRESLYLAFLLPYGFQAEPIIAGLALTYVIGVPFMVWGWALFSKMSLSRPDPGTAERVPTAHEPL